ncbi:MAG: carotenoid 1,2-hydratase [Vicinamibacterales bacterium]
MYTGNVDTTAGRRFGYQVTFFRVGVDRAPVNPSAWAVRDLFMAHLAVSDVSGARYRFAEKLTRGGPGLSGADTARYRVWNEDWSVRLDDRGRHVLHAAGEQAGVDLVLDEGQPPVINGVNGISQKGAQAGNASHYYSLTRMPTAARSPSTANVSTSRARAGWTTSSAPASSNASSRAGTGCRCSSAMAGN